MQMGKKVKVDIFCSYTNFLSNVYRVNWNLMAYNTTVKNRLPK